MPRNMGYDELYHYGILGMKWGIRRYQNKDGSLTELGKKRLGIDSDTSKGRFDSDIMLKKGTQLNRVYKVNPRHEYYNDSDFKKAKIKARQIEKELADKYVSVDVNGGKNKGDEYYLSWLSNEGYDGFDHILVDTFTANKDLNIASGKKVLDELIKEYGDFTLSDFKKYSTTSKVKKLSLEYSKNKDLREKINSELKNQGYDGVLDINDLDTDLPIVIFNSNRNIKKEKTYDALEYIDKNIKPRYSSKQK